MGDLYRRAEVRDARCDDLPGIRHVARTTWDHAYREIVPEEVRKGFVERAYSQASLEQVTLRVERENAPTRRFYERRGFVVDRHQTDVFLGHELHEVEMALTLGETPTG